MKLICRMEFVHFNCQKRRIILSYTFLILTFGFVDSFHIVASGPCLNQIQNYCQNIVQNSYCSPEKNECFCQNGFVAIKEKNGLICKTLLTNLKCSMDRDCKDVYGSSCHPGPGQCACPAETFYVSQDHVCKFYANNSVEVICKMCNSIGGKCYDNSITSMTDNIKIPELRCSCPGILYNPPLMKGQLINQSPLQVCRGILVDLGSYCNDKDILCRAKIAECVHSSAIGYKICICPRDHISVYQTHLRYYECYPKIERHSKFCEHCQNSQGWCIDMNGDSNEDCCHCGKWNSSSIQDETDFNNPLCRENSMSVKCSSFHLEVCIKDDKFIPAKRSSVDEYTSAIFFSPSSSHVDHQCIVIGIRTNKLTTCYQLSKSSQTQMFHSNCSIVSSGVDNIYYNAFLSIRKNRYIFDLANDFLFDVSCKVDLKRESSSFGQTTDKSWNGELQFRELLNYNFEDIIYFSLIDIRNKIVTQVKVTEMLAVDISFRKENVRFSFFLPEECSVHHETRNSIIYSRSKDLTASSPDQNDFNLFSFSTSPNIDQSGSFSIRSNYFPAFILKLKGKIKLSCVFRICQLGVWCDQNFHWKQAVTPDIKIPNSHDNIKFVKSNIDFEIGDKKCCTLTSRAIENKVQCLDLLCLTPAQILTVVISVCTLAILLSFIIILLFKKRRRMKNNDQNRANTAEQTADLYELSVLKPNCSTHHRFPSENVDEDSSKSFVTNKFTDDILPQDLNGRQHDVTLAKEYDFYVNLSALNSGFVPQCSRQDSLPKTARITADVVHSSPNIVENHCSFLGHRTPVHVRHHICSSDGQRFSKCSKTTAV